ncbi:MAG: nucleoside hydrolase [Bacteroidales bacterium]|nr:nucleoside hydrolase [Bacteroidales bacterium]
MRIQHTCILLCLLLSSFSVSAHSGKARYHAIIETDGGLDDMRAISLLLASAETEVIGIYCTDGILSPSQTARNVLDMLSTYHHEGIPVGYADAFLVAEPVRRDLLQQVLWGASVQKNEPEQVPDFLQKIYTAEDEKITYICLGSLRAIITEVCQHEWMLKKTEKIVWYNEENDHDNGFNLMLYQQDCQSIPDAGLNFVQVSPLNENMPGLDDTFWKEAKSISSRYAESLAEIHNSPFVREQLKTGREHIWDELVAIYLSNPDMFYPAESNSIPGQVVFRPSDPEMLIPVYLDMMKERSPDYKIFSRLPLDTAYYQEDVAVHMGDILERYGESEWRAGVLCFELHGHIGIYAIIGVKMGLRAREYFNIGLDDLYIESHAGLSPPYSCLNDGLQVSTGSSLGHGLIHAEATSSPEVSATFTFKGKSVLISLKQQIVSKMEQDIQACIKKNGMLTPAYWAAVRELAMSYWPEYNRNQIFNITKKN